MSDDGKSIFSRYVETASEKEQPSVTVPKGPMLRPVVPPSDYRAPPIEKLLDWLVNRWPKDTVKTKNILQFGPKPLRNRKSARATAELLEKNGWLTRLKTRCYREHEWRIERGPSESR